eukprot:36852_1
MHFNVHVGSELVLSKPPIYGFGYKSLYGPSTSITTNKYSHPNQVFCGGAFACAQISFINASQYWLYCDGGHSCANIDKLSYINVGYVVCRGSNSCQNSNIIANGGVHCRGSQSCIYTNISTTNVHAFSAYSLYASVIDSQLVTDSLNVHLYGYQSGFGATVICRAGDICNIYCYNNGCEILYVECEQNSECNILQGYEMGMMEERRILLNDSSITIPPITDMNEYDYTFYDIKYDTQTLNITNNKLCDNASNFVYDNNNEHSGIIEINEQNTGPVCCRGYLSCKNTVSIAFTDIVSDIVVCSGSQSCENTIINTTKSVFCE